MTTRRFVIPAAGKATRFGGIPKELLPISKTRCGLTHAVELATTIGQCAPVVVTTKEMRWLHKKTIANAGLRAIIIVDPKKTLGDMWESVLCGLDGTMPGGLIMPDTVPVLTDQQPSPRASALSLGCFLTSSPEQYSCLELGGLPPRIRTKEPNEDTAIAWGMVMWDAQAAQDLSKFRGHYDRAFESIMQSCGCDVFMLKSYADLGTFARYQEYIKCG